MSLTILEVLENAQYNLQSNIQFKKELGLEQLNNALRLINEDDLTLYDDFPE